MSVVGRFQFHAVAVDHAIRGDDSSSAVNQLEGGFFAVHCLVLVHRHCAAFQRHDMAFPDLLQVREVGDDRGMLAAEREIDQVLDYETTPAYGP